MMHPVHDAATVAECLKVAGLDAISGELARRARVYESMAKDLVVFSRHEDCPRRVEQFATQCGAIAQQARRCHEGCSGLGVNDGHVKEAAAAATTAADAYILTRAMVRRKVA